MDKKRTIVFIFFLLILIPVLINAANSEDSFENTMKKIEMLDGNNKVEYDKIQPIKDQFNTIW